MYGLKIIIASTLVATSASADPMKLRQIGGSVPSARFAISAPGQPLFSPSMERQTRERQTLAMPDVIGDGIKVGMMKLRRNGDLCISFRRHFRRCDMMVGDSELLVYVREHNLKTPVRIQLGIRP
ncbi:hypothetical protein ACFORG_09010 [Lutimaribacter marinistellae]|uniref:Uncharacterized protein n=1 Tax=Lutimaribacter marinistellae TaxID=1820329 RepID=A0ABV7TGM7_9RHOB